MVPCKSSAEGLGWSHHRISSTDWKVRTTLHVSIIDSGSELFSGSNLRKARLPKNNEAQDRYVPNVICVFSLVVLFWIFRFSSISTFLKLPHISLSEATNWRSKQKKNCQISGEKTKSTKWSFISTTLEIKPLIWLTVLMLCVRCFWFTIKIPTLSFHFPFHYRKKSWSRWS